jgi:hypothetical protein
MKTLVQACKEIIAARSQFADMIDECDEHGYKADDLFRGAAHRRAEHRIHSALKSVGCATVAELVQEICDNNHCAVVIADTSEGFDFQIGRDAYDEMGKWTSTGE